MDLKVSLNLSARNPLDAQLPEQIEQLLRASSLPASRIVLEITERALMVNPTASLKVIAQLDALGAGLSIDDYGTGYSSLSFLRGLPLDELKIDRSLVQHMDQDTNDEVIVRSTVDLAHNFGPWSRRRGDKRRAGNSASSAATVSRVTTSASRWRRRRSTPG